MVAEIIELTATQIELLHMLSDEALKQQYRDGSKIRLAEIAEMIQSQTETTGVTPVAITSPPQSKARPAPLSSPLFKRNKDHDGYRYRTLLKKLSSPNPSDTKKSSDSVFVTPLTLWQQIKSSPQKPAALKRKQPTKEGPDSESNTINARQKRRKLGS